MSKTNIINKGEMVFASGGNRSGTNSRCDSGGSIRRRTAYCHFITPGGSGLTFVLLGHKSVQGCSIHWTKTEFIRELFLTCGTKFHRCYLYLPLGEWPCTGAFKLSLKTVGYALIERFRWLWNT